MDGFEEIKMSLSLYLLSQTVCDGYDTYDSCVVAAESELEAKKIHPNGYYDSGEENWWDDAMGCSWPNKLEDIDVVYIGSAVAGIKKGVVCSSFNAG
jgi:hypothetical protein